MRLDRYALDTMTVHEIADLRDALERDRVRREKITRQDELEGNETVNVRAMARAMKEEENNG